MVALAPPPIDRAAADELAAACPEQVERACAALAQAHAHRCDGEVGQLYHRIHRAAQRSNKIPLPRHLGRIVQCLRIDLAREKNKVRTTNGELRGLGRGVSFTSLDAEMAPGDDRGRTLHERIESPEPWSLDPESVSERFGFWQEHLLGALSERELEIIQARLSGETNEATARRLGCSASLLSHYAGSAIEKMRREVALLEKRDATGQGHTIRPPTDPFVAQIAGLLGMSIAELKVAAEAGRLPYRALLQLSPGEIEIAAAVAEGKTSAEIARARGVTVRTVENQRTRALRKIGLRNVADLTRYALARGWAKNEFLP